MKLSVEKIKSIIIVILVCILVFGGSFASSEIMYYKNSCSISKVEEESHFQNISIESYLSLFSLSNMSFVYIGKSDCQYSMAQDVVFQELFKQYDLKVYYLGLDDLSKDAIEALYSSYDSFVTDGLATPTLMLIENGEVVGFKKGYTSLENLISFLQEKNLL